MNPKVSIILPFFNAERYLRTALDSVASQFSRDFECICVDDGSTDGSAEIAASLQRQDGRFRLIRIEHGGAGAARNEGIAAANGECLAFLDADDMYEPDFLQEMLGEYERQEKCDIVVCEAWRYSGEKGVLEPAAQCFVANRFEVADYLNCTPGMPWNKLFSHAFVDRHGFRFLDLPSCEDVGFVYPALAMATRIGAVRKRLVRHRVDNSGSLEHSKCGVGTTVFYDAYLTVRNQLRERGAYGRVREAFIRRVGTALQYNASVLRDLVGLRAFYDRVMPNAVRDFELLGDVASAFDEELCEMCHCTFEEYVLRRLRQARQLPAVKAECKRLAVRHQALMKSASFRLGRALTFLPRQVRDACRSGFATMRNPVR